MVQITPTVKNLKNYLLKIAADNYEKQVNTVTLTPTNPVTTWKGGTPDAVYQDTGTPTWVLDLGYAQDWQTTGSLSIYLLNNQGSTVAMEFSPLAGGPKFTANVLIVPGAIGGAIDTTPTATVSLLVQGQPVYVPATPAIPVISGTTPFTGAAAGGTLVKVTGSNFTGTTLVKFGTVNALAFFVDDDGTLYATAPAQAVGSKAITVTNATGVSTTTGAYTYV